MALQKTTRWVLAGVAAVALLLVGPMLLIVGSNAGAAILDLVLNRRPKAAELLGNYRLQAPWGYATLRINADGTFQEELYQAGKSTRSVSGRWQSREESNFVDVDFQPFGMVWDEDHNRDTSSYGINFYKPHVGATYGMIDDDLGEKFEKQ
jgi:hypothetical protein